VRASSVWIGETVSVFALAILLVLVRPVLDLISHSRQEAAGLSIIACIGSLDIFIRVQLFQKPGSQLSRTYSIVGFSELAKIIL
jgi:hypothetical protein